MMRDIRVEAFLERVSKQLYTEESSKDIEEELNDHIHCLVDEYEADGYSQDLAVSKALLQMGDPKEIGYSFTDYEGMKKRNLILKCLKISSLMSVVITVLTLIISSEEDLSFSMDGWDSISMVPNILNIFFIFTTGSWLMGHSVKYLDLDTRPEIIIWPTKQRFKWEYMILAFIFTPLIVVMFFVHFYEVGVTQSSVLALWPLVTIGYSIWAYILSEKYRMPKFMILDEGILVKGRFISWAGIQRFTWTKDFYSKERENYVLCLHGYQAKSGLQGMKKNIPVHQRQQKYINALLRERV
jgi:hypothetical protein